MITGPAQPLGVVIANWTNVLCSGAAQGVATAEASGGTGPYTYSWDTPMQQTGVTAFNLPAGTYSVTATDANGCTANTSVTILGPNLGIEAIVEDIEQKQIAFKSMEAIVTEKTILASNTSSLSISAMGAQLKRPDRILGVHFFNPAPLMRLVEIIPGLQTDPEVVERGKKL